MLRPLCSTPTAMPTSILRCALCCALSSSAHALLTLLYSTCAARAGLQDEAAEAGQRVPLGVLRSCRRYPRARGLHTSTRILDYSTTL